MGYPYSAAEEIMAWEQKGEPVSQKMREILDVMACLRNSAYEHGYQEGFRVAKEVGIR